MDLKLFAGLALLSLAAACTPPAPVPPAPAAVAAQPAAPVFEPLDIVTAKGPVHFRVEVADDEAEREQGLMFRTHLDDDQGMLFDFHTPQQVSFWMKNTLIPLDMIFIRADGTIANIEANTEPYSETPIPSDGEVLGVLEIGGGLTQELGVKPGDKVVHRIFSK
ncbi:MAG: DUF192 domain-containing protein [Parcubacteria group bacterium]